MRTVTLNDDIYKELHILTKSEYDQINPDYRGRAKFDWNIKTAFLPGYGTKLFYENRHFLVINEKEPVRTYAIWRNRKVIGYCEITWKAAEKANGASNAEFYFSDDPVTCPKKYERVHGLPVTLIGNQDGVYINPANCNAYVDYTKAENFGLVNMEGVNHLVIKRSESGEMKIIQAGGWTLDRGLFVDMY